MTSPYQQQLKKQNAVIDVMVKLPQRIADIGQRRADLSLVGTQLSDSVAVTPIDGVVLVKSAEPGEVLAAGPDAGQVSVEWNGDCYPGVVAKKEGGRSFVHYTGFDPSWDEWVGPERLNCGN